MKITKIIIQKVLISLFIIIVLISVGVNAYFLGWKRIETNLLQKGFNIAVNQIIQQIQWVGQVQIGEIILIQKK